jgi:aromatic-L-amino-acid/L-tryptophan decarboxylase
VSDPLGLSPAEMRRLGHRVVDLVVDALEDLDDSPVVRTGAAPELRAELGGPVPEGPGDADAALDVLTRVALTHVQRAHHPRYFARIPSPAAFAGVLGDWLATGHNVIATSWRGSAGPITVELVVCEWLASLCGLPPETEGILLSGGSIASLTALAAARAHAGPGVAYLSDQTHASLPRALEVLGFPPEDVHVLPADAGQRLDAGAVAAAVADDRRAGRRPGFVLATAGTTNTGAVDPLDTLADLCAAEGLWLHVDGAYGAAATLAPEGRAALPGLERADSLVLDPHKWLFQPYDAGCLLVRHPGVLSAAYAMAPDYLADTRGDGEVNLRDRSPELSRRSRALKLWLTFRIHGLAGLRAAIARGLALAREAQALIEADPRLEVVTPAQLGIVTFALRDAEPGEHALRAARLGASGYADVTSSVVGDRAVLRLCTINPTTTRADLEGTLERLAAG